MVSKSFCWTLNNYTEEEYEYLTSSELIDRVSYHIVAKEVGAQGTPHLQGYTVLRRASRFTGLKRLFKTDRVHVELRRGTHEQASDYCKKSDPEFFEYGTPPNDAVAVKPSSYSLISQCETYEEACSLVERNNPRDWYLSGDRIRENLKRKFVPEFSPYVPIFEVRDFRPPQELVDWVNSWQVSRTPCLFLIGPSKFGKTAWARSLCEPHTYWKGMVNLDEFNPASGVVIFDDFEWKYMPSPKCWLTQAGQCTVTDKYRHKRTILVTMPAIYIANELPDWTANERSYWSVNSKIVNVVASLY